MNGEGKGMKGEGSAGLEADTVQPLLMACQNSVQTYAGFLCHLGRQSTAPIWY